MSLNSLLNSDLTTLIGNARGAYGWWIDELFALAPQTLRGWSTTKRKTVIFDDDGRLTPSNPVDKASSSSWRNAVIVIPQSAVLLRQVETPATTRAELSRALALNSERYFPLPSGSILLASAAQSVRNDAGTMQTDVAALPLACAARLAEALREADIVPQSVRIAGNYQSADRRFNFLPAMRAAGLVDASDGNSRKWWLVVAAFALLNLAAIVWRDAAEVDRLQALVDAQRPAVGVAQRMAMAMQAMDASAHRAATRRGEQEPLRILAAATAAVPEGAWVQRYAWDGGTLRLTGYRARDADVATALRRAGRFANVKSTQTDSMAETVTGQPFDLAAEIRVR